MMRRTELCVLICSICDLWWHQFLGWTISIRSTLNRGMQIKLWATAKTSCQVGTDNATAVARLDSMQLHLITYLHVSEAIASHAAQQCCSFWVAATIDTFHIHIRCTLEPTHSGATTVASCECTSTGVSVSHSLSLRLSFEGKQRPAFVSSRWGIDGWFARDAPLDGACVCVSLLPTANETKLSPRKL